MLRFWLTNTLGASLVAFRKMPTGLRYITGFCLLMTTFLFVAFLPLDWQIGDKPVSFAEFWKRGGGPSFCAVGAFFALLSYGFIRPWPWVRQVFIATGALAIVASTIITQVLTVEALILFILWCLLPSWYLFRPKPIRAYF